MSKYNTDANPGAVRDYLQAAYLDVDRERAKDLVRQFDAIVERGISFRSFSGYVGDEIAEAAGLTENPDFKDEDEDDA